MTKTTLPTRWLLALILLGAVLPGVAATEQDREARYDELIATFVWKFAKYVTWPDGTFTRAEDPFVIGVVGDDDFARLLEDTVRDETARKRKFRVERLRSIDFHTPSQVDRLRERLHRCHIVYISRRPQPRVPKILELLKDRSILTVSDIDAFAHHGGMIEFVVVEEKLTLEIHRTPVARARLEMHSQLLKVAARTYTDPE